MSGTFCDCEDSLSDLLCDLMHWADRCGMSFPSEYRRARRHYTAEMKDTV